MKIGEMFKKAKQSTEDFLSKQETKDAISKLKEEMSEAKTKVNKMMEEGDVILKRKVDSFLNKNKKTEDSAETNESVKENVDVGDFIEDVVVAEVVVDIVETTNEPVVTVEEPKKEVAAKKVIIIKDNEEPVELNVLDLDLTDKIKSLLVASEFNTVEKIKSATDAELGSIDGIGAAAIKKIRAAL